MIALHLISETPPEGSPWASAEIRLLRPYTHRSMSRELTVSVGNSLPNGPVHAAVLQRGGPVGSTIGEIVDLVSRIKARGARLIYDLDDDLLADHPSMSVERFLDGIRPKVRFLLREADAITVSTQVLADRLRRHNPNVIVWQNALDEAIVPPLSAKGRNFSLGYFGTNSHLQNLMAVIGQLAESAAQHNDRPSFELCGISDDRRIAGLLGSGLEVRLRAAQGNYGQFHRTLATKARWAVGIAPLMAGPFNDAKSDIKALDYAAAGIPAIVSDVPAYANLADGETVLRVPITEFGEAAFALLHDEDRQRQLAKVAHNNLLETRVLAVRAPELLAILKQILDRAPFVNGAAV